MSKVYMIYALREVSEKEREDVLDAVLHLKLAEVPRFYKVEKTRIYLDGPNGTIRTSITVNRY